MLPTYLIDAYFDASTVLPSHLAFSFLPHFLPLLLHFTISHMAVIISSAWHVASMPCLCTSVTDT